MINNKPQHPLKLTRSLAEISLAVFSWLRGCHDDVPVLPALEIMPAWQESDWRAVELIIYVHGIGPLLYNFFRQRQLLAQIPDSFREYLHTQYHLNQERISRLLQRQLQIIEDMAEQGVIVIPLKGSHLIPLYYQDAAMRPMADLDVLVRPEDEATLSVYLQAQNFQLIEHSPRHRAFIPACYSDQLSTAGQPTSPQPEQVLYSDGEHPDNPYFIDVHTELGERYWGIHHELTQTYWQHVVSIDWCGRCSMLGEPVALLLHLLSHTAHNALRCTLRMIQLVDISLVAKRLSDAEWQDLADSAEQGGVQRFLYAPLYLMERYLGPIVPSFVLDMLRRESPKPLLRLLDRATLCDLSYCNPDQASLWNTLKWFRFPDEQWQAMRSILRGLPKGQSMIANNSGHSKMRIASLLHQRLQNQPRSGWAVFANAGISQQQAKQG